jgi:beta-lactamase class A
MTNSGYEEKNKITINRSLMLTLVAGAFALGIFIGAATGLFSPLPSLQGESLPEGPEGTFRFIRVSVEAKHAGEKLMTNRELKPFQYKVNSLIESDLKNADAKSITVYFRDLNNGNRFVIGEHGAFNGENHLKLPLMIAYFKWAESNPLVLRKKLIFVVKPETEQHRETAKNNLEPGKLYTVNDLIFRMIAYDDDAAYVMLSANLPANRLDKIFKDLNGEYDPQKQNESLSLNTYAALFRVLFNASYLSEEMSEKALRYLSKTAFQDGIGSAVPPNVDKAVDHEEVPIRSNGEGENSNVRQLQEFGIIYHQNRPFLLGVIVRGSDDSRLETVIRDVTRLVFQEVDQQS